ncbi:MAG: class I SAM-dependent methyltransferase [archaeon]
MSEESIKNLVLEGYSSDSVQKTYRVATMKGLWPSERIVYDKYFRKGSSILDIGCGSGRTTFALRIMGYNVIGTDLTPAMIKTAEELKKEFKINIDFRIMDATNLKYSDNSFDNTLFSFCGWNQIPGKENRIKALEEAYRVTKKGGYFIFTSHIRTYASKWGPFWFKQWIKMNAFKPLGLNIKEQEFGDRYFRKGASGKFETEEFLHIPNLKEVELQIKEAGFELEYNDYRRSITPDDKKVKAGNCMYFVCRKK